MENFESWKKFGKNRENSWNFSFSDRFFRKMPVSFSASYKVLADFVPKSILVGLVSVIEVVRQRGTL